MTLVIAMVAGYLIGSVSFAVLVSRSLGLDDPRSYGSGNPGATNVLRSGNRKAALLTLVGDTLKGAVAVWLARALAGVLGLDPLGVMLVGAAAFVGHLYPVFHRFAGGKGVATAAGVLLAIAPWHGLAVVSTWLIIAYFFRYSSLAALVAAVFAPLYWVFLFGTGPTVWPVVAMSALLLWRHRGNIAKLLRGEESRIGDKRATAGGDPVG
ncbi:MAG: glycerol-3-phosphate 1-O-acyltransferase PlsY [Burkholderiaceae bacterium]